jgi:hypothetical protein
MRPISSQKSKNLSPKLVALAIGLLLVILGVAYLWYQASNKPQTETQQTPSDTAGNNGPTKQDIANGDNPVTSTPQNVPQQTGITVGITKLEQSNGSVVIAGAVTGDEGGKCVATFSTPEDRPVIKEVAATKNGGQTVCGPITINEVEFSYLGNWQAKLTYYTSDNKGQASSESKTITIH